MDNHYIMYQKFNSDKRMSITQVANGWILELPKVDTNHRAMTEMIPTVIKAIRQDPGDLETILQESNIHTATEPYIPFDTEVFVFGTFEELMGFIKLNSDPEQNK